MVPKGTIRSAAHRQILAWLRQGPATVSDIAEQFAMRMPHASLACRQLRDSGLVVRDESGGLRNAPMYLSQAGRDRLRENGVAKLKQHAHRFDRKSAACVLQADASDVLIGYVEPPESPLVFVPQSTDFSDQSSSGNEGGVWVLLEEEDVEWYRLEDFTSTSPPSFAQGTTLQDFGQRPAKVALARGRVFEYGSSDRLVDGQAFHLTSPSGPISLTRLDQGEVVLGRVYGTEIDFRPGPGLLGHLPAALDRSLVLDALGNGAVQVTDRFGTRERRLPVSVMDTWIEARHPRMSAEKREVMASELKANLLDAPQTLPAGVTRELLLDFGEAKWYEGSWSPGPLDIYGLSARGVEALLLNLFSTSGLPVCVDWPFVEPPSLTSHLRGHPACRVWLARRGEPPVEPADIVALRPSPRLSVVMVQLARNTRFPLQLQGPKAAVQIEPTDVSMPADALSLMQRHETVSDARSTALPAGAQGQRMQTALSLYPVGDEERANRWEGEDVLSAWIASEPQHRPARFVRVHARLPDGWVDLMPVDETPLSLLPLAIGKASSMWADQAFQRLRYEMERSPKCVVDLVEGLGHADASTWFATCLLSMLDPLVSEHRTLISKALQVWRASPHAEVTVLEHLFPWREGILDRNEDLLAEVKEVAAAMPKGTVLREWMDAVELAQSGSPWLPELQRRCMEFLPERWWRCYAADWLVAQLSSVSGRAWLRRHSVCWMAQVFAPAGLLSGIPGCPVAQRPHDLTSEQLISVKMLGEGGGASMLDDVYEALYAAEQNLPPPLLKSHPQGAWLAWPVEVWPPWQPSIVLAGDERIGTLLLTMQFAHSLRP